MACLQPQPNSTLLTKLGFLALTGNSALAIYRSRDDPGSVAFVAGAYGGIALLFHLLRRIELELERGGEEEGDRGRRRTKAAVWALTTLLTAMFAYRVAPLMPLAIGVLVFLCLGELDKVLRRGGRINMAAGQYYSALSKVGFAVVTCHAALDGHGYGDDDARGDPSSAAFVLASFVGLVVLTGLFVRSFAQARASEQEQQ